MYYHGLLRAVIQIHNLDVRNHLFKLPIGNRLQHRNSSIPVKYSCLPVWEPPPWPELKKYSAELSSWTSTTIPNLTINSSLLVNCVFKPLWPMAPHLRSCKRIQVYPASGNFGWFRHNAQWVVTSRNGTPRDRRSVYAARAPNWTVSGCTWPMDRDQHLDLHGGAVRIVQPPFIFCCP